MEPQQTPPGSRPAAAPANTVGSQGGPQPTVAARPVQSAQPGIAAQPSQGTQMKSVLRPMARELTQKPVKKGSSMKKKTLVLVGVILTLLLGTGSGYMLAVNNSGETVGGLKNEPGLQREVTTGTEIKAGTKVGVADERTFKDSVEGTLQKGGIDGEGSHHLVRPGGDSQNVYLTSSIIDLDQFASRKVKIWGETVGAQKAGWLMDVGKLEVLE